MTQSADQYKHTLNLPETNFPMKGNLPVKELEILTYWQDLKLYQRQRESFAGKEKFILHDGPPYANGALHLGHAVNKILKDIIVKSQGQLGLDAPYVPGWDCHGLPIELVVEKKHGKVGVQLDAPTFREHCRQFALSQVEIQKKGFIRFGILGDWENPYLTLHARTEAETIRALAKIVSNGHLERGLRPVNWCLECSSSLAEAEVEYEEKTSYSIDVKFPVMNESELATALDCTLSGKGKVSVIIWTTTPWTLPGNEAVSLHADYDYVLLQVEDERFIVAADLIEALQARWQKNCVELQRFKGKKLDKLLLKHPLFDKQVLVVLGEHVALDAGTGCVHTAPAHGNEDWEVGLIYNLPVDNPVLANGVYASYIPKYAGLHIRKAEPVIIDDLRHADMLVAETKISHQYPHCWRHKTPTIFRATPQWFISMDKNGLRKNILNEIRQVKFTPDWGQARLELMIANRGDWCISRQRSWGVPIPFFLDKETGALHPNTVDLMEIVADRVETQGLEAWFQATVQEYLSAEDADHYEKNQDILDVWFDSGTTHSTVLKHRSELAFPADLYLEGSDQHRGWFNSSICTSVAMYQKASYKGVLTHGFTVDAQGRKMSKSLKNGIDPDDIIHKMGADILRLWIASTDYRGEIPVSEEILKRTADVYRRLRNTARFLLANLTGFDPAKDLLPASKLLALDQWVIDRAFLLQQELALAYKEYNFHHIFQKLHHFCSIELGSFYLDVIKDRQYTCAKDSVARRSCQTALYHILEALVRWLAPILSFTAEEIWLHMPKIEQRPPSVFLTNFYEGLTPLADDSVLGRVFWDKVLTVRIEVAKALEKARAEGVIGSSLAAELTLYVSPSLHQLLSLLENELRFVFITSEVNVLPLTDLDNEAVIHLTEHESLMIVVNASLHQKCVRCWHHRADVGQHEEHPLLCERCIENLTPSGEVRHFA